MVSKRACRDIYKHGKYRSDGSDSSEDDESFIEVEIIIFRVPNLGSMMHDDVEVVQYQY